MSKIKNIKQEDNTNAKPRSSLMKSSKKKYKKIMKQKRKLQNMTNISRFIKKLVLKRDNAKCIICDNTQDLQVHHIIERSKGGLGIKENLVTLCEECHKQLHSRKDTDRLKEMIKAYINILYPNFRNSDRIYKHKQGRK